MENKRGFLIKDILNETTNLQPGLLKIKNNYPREDIKNKDLLLKLAKYNCLQITMNKHAVDSRSDSSLAEPEELHVCISPKPTTSLASSCITLPNKDMDQQDLGCSDFERLTNAESNVGVTSAQFGADQDCCETMQCNRSEQIGVNHNCPKDCQTLLRLASKGLSLMSSADNSEYNQKIIPPYTAISQSALVSEQCVPMRHFHHRLVHHHPHLITKTRKRDKKVRRPRTNFTDEQLRELESLFLKQKYLNVQERVELAERLGLNEIQIKTWYQNRRTKWKRQNQMKVEYFGQTIHHHHQGRSSYHQQLPDISASSQTPVKPSPIHLADILGGTGQGLGVGATSAVAQHQQRLIAHPNGGGYMVTCGEPSSLQQALALCGWSYY